MRPGYQWLWTAGQGAAFVQSRHQPMTMLSLVATRLVASVAENIRFQLGANTAKTGRDAK